MLKGANSAKRGERYKKGANPVRPFEVAVSIPFVAFSGGVDGTRIRDPNLGAYEPVDVQ